MKGIEKEIIHFVKIKCVVILWKLNYDFGFNVLYVHMQLIKINRNRKWYAKRHMLSKILFLKQVNAEGEWQADFLLVNKMLPCW